MKRLRSVFFGTPEFARLSLVATAANTEVVAVVTQPDRPRGRGQKLSPCEVKAAASRLGLPVYSPASLKKDTEELRELKTLFANANIDLMIVVAYGNLLPQEILDVPKLACINVHGSLLPRWRGAAPIQRCLENGDRETGVCLQKMVLEMDAGDILAQSNLSVPPEMDALELSDHLAIEGSDLLGHYLSHFSLEKLERRTVQDPSQVSFAAKLKKSEGLWSEAWTSFEVHNRVRAFIAWPGVRARSPEGDFKFLKTSLEFSFAPRLAPGEVAIQDSRVFLGAADGRAVAVVEVQPVNRGRTNAFAYFQNLLYNAAPHDGQPSLRILKIADT